MDILIVTFNRSRYLAKCLESLETASDDMDRVLIWNNNVQDQDAAAVAKAFVARRSAAYVGAPNNVACAGGRNGGLAWLDEHGKPTADHVLMLDDDVWLRTNWRMALKVFEDLGNVGVVALYDARPEEDVISTYTCGDLVYREKTKVNTAAAIISRDAFERVGGYVESGKAMDWISTRFCKDLRLAGFGIYAIASPALAENMDHPKHPKNEREFYESTGYEAFRRMGKKRKVFLGDEGKFFSRGTP